MEELAEKIFRVLKKKTVGTGIIVEVSVEVDPFSGKDCVLCVLHNGLNYIPLCIESKVQLKLLDKYDFTKMIKKLTLKKQ